MFKEAVVAGEEVTAEVLPTEIRQWYQQYAQDTWHSLDTMVYPNGLPADHLHYLRTADGKPTEITRQIDKTSPTNLGFKLACDCAACALGEITPTEALSRLETSLATIQRLMQDPQVFVSTRDNKGLFVNWIQPSSGKVLDQWPGTNRKVIQQLSSVDNGWFAIFSKLPASLFPQLKNTINRILDHIDLPFMLDQETGFFRGVYFLDPPGFSTWEYDKISEGRIMYGAVNDETAALMTKLIETRSHRSTFIDSTGRCGRSTWQGEGFAALWPELCIPEDTWNPQWRDTYLATIQAQRDFGCQYNGGHYGYSAGLGPDGYFEFRVPQTGENTADYQPHPVITLSALVNMGIVEPIETYYALQRLHREFPDSIHSQMGDGDTINTATGGYQPDQLFPNQATSLLACWNILKNRQPQSLFEQAAPPKLREVYQTCRLW